MKNENPLQMDLFSIPAEENDQYVCLKCGKKSFDCYPGNLCKECYEEPGKISNIEAVANFHRGTSASVEDYVNKMLNVYREEKDYNYDVSDDDLVDDNDVVGYCMACGKKITKSDVAQVNALEYVWQKKDGRFFFAFVCRKGHSQEYSDKKPGSMVPGYYYDFHKKYLELCELTEAEYIEDLRQNQPTVFKARQDGGQYIELCKEWAEAGKNDAGVFVENVKKYEAGKRFKMWIMIETAKAFPFIYAEMELDARDYGQGSPLTDEEEWGAFKFSVFQPAAEILEGLKKQVEGRIDRNGNLDDDDRAKLKALLPKVLGQLEKDLV